jgi:hypothetical protein
MLVPALFSLGFGATALTTQPGPAVLGLILLYALFNGGALPYTLAIFMGALSASLLGKPAGWRSPLHNQPLWTLALLAALYAASMWSCGSATMEPLLLAANHVVEHLLLEPEIFLSKSLVCLATLALCTWVGDLMQIYCCLLVVAACWAYIHWRTSWANLKNALHWGT